jgi:hypothetical protein
MSGHDGIQLGHLDQFVGFIQERKPSIGADVPAWSEPAFHTPLFFVGTI